MKCVLHGANKGNKKFTLEVNLLLIDILKSLWAVMLFWKNYTFINRQTRLKANQTQKEKKKKLKKEICYLCKPDHKCGIDSKSNEFCFVEPRRNFSDFNCVKSTYYHN